MLELSITELRKVGLVLNTKKTKILHSSDADEGAEKDFVLIDDDFVQVLHSDQFHRYLGRYLNLCPGKRVNIEIDNR